MPTASLFRAEYEMEMEGWLRTRFRRLCYLYIVFEGLALLVHLLQIGLVTQWTVALPIVAAAAKLGFVVAFLYVGRWEHATREQALRAATWMILFLGALTLVSDFLVHTFQGDGRVNALGSIFFWHLTACLFLPWTPRESLRPIVPLLAVWAAGMLWQYFAAFNTLLLLSIALSPIIVVPGLLICAWRLRRHGERFRSRMIGKHFWSMRQEFERARSIHESMFPQPCADGSVRFDYAYSPATDIGGDYVHLHVTDEGCWHLTLLDVTGHGLVAALTVNRIFGELERIRAESPDAQPAEVLTLLNRYFYLTLQRHNIFATAIAVTLDPRAGEVRWCSAGHPPAYLRGANGAVRELTATETLLGALDPQEFEAGQQRVQLSVGDVLIAYTDGAFEAANRTGEHFGLQRLRRLLTITPSASAAKFNWTRYIAGEIEKHAGGRVDDDVLVAALIYEQPAHTRRSQVAHEPLDAGV